MGSDRAQIESTLRGYVVERLLDGDVGVDEDPLTTDSVDSLGLEQLVDFVRREFGVEIRGEEMVRKNFGSIAALATLVEAKRAGSPGSS